MTAKLPSLLTLVIPTISLAAVIDYPATRKAEVSEELHGTKVSDPYRWLEDDNAEETKGWVTAQNKVTESFLETVPQRGEIRKRLADLWNFERTGAPREYGGKWFFTHNTGLQNQSVLKVSDSIDGEGRLLLDPNTLSADGTVALANFSPSEDGKLLGYSISRGGSDWNEILVRDVATGKDTGDHLKWVKFSGISWAKDGSGFYYARYDAPPEGAALTQKNEYQKLCFHKIGTPQSEDKVIYERKDQPRWGFGGGVTEDGKYLVIRVSEGTDPKNRFFYRPVEEEEEKVIELLADADASYDFIGNEGSEFYFRTDLDAPRHRIIAIDVTKPERSAWKEIIPQSKDLLQEASMVGGKLVVEYLQDAKSAVAVFDVAGKKIRDVDLPGIGSAGGFSGRQQDKETFYSFTSFTDPGAIYRYDLASGESTLWKSPKVGFDGSAYETKQVFVPSKDGTKVPVFIVHKKGITLDGSHRTLLTGYGGFNISITPGFSIGRAVWLERGGILAVANLRGGGEYGSDWHQAGTRLQKQNVFDDFIAAGEWLVKENYTSPQKLAIQGGSNGGLLVGACMTQRPDLFGAALPAVGVLDMLRFHKFTIGWAWEKDYGSAENPEEFKALLQYSPYHVLKSGTRYPATMVTTADHDDRVVPAHSFKFAARLQECQAKEGPPVLIRIDTSAGHGAGTALSKMIDKTADEWAFLEKVL
ncbi:prolyl oligopeptidase family serine peptidase [Luteolibacter flavescens]|uniref:prolyl oligopeptidase n=1 Tax=Luteolibacter flavescens TaxID=1859460 RepID=A0ABT3FWU3_9BACT|nr:prolyl oligopeptidase family serine peptidase [Luteolibacter flavescens]MCW1887470.1 prolyl oligopeptidase family serine peptidase [Luteolibacter flavescens]